jgi:hypothetical protein
MNIFFETWKTSLKIGRDREHMTSFIFDFFQCIAMPFISFKLLLFLLGFTSYS